MPGAHKNRVPNHMKFVSVLLLASLLISCGGDDDDDASTDSNKVIIYENDFSSDSLNDFVVGEIGVATVNIELGKLQINPGTGYLNRGFVALDLAAISSNYMANLDDNTAKITWAFNVSNIDGTVCSSCNNTFGFYLYSFPDPSEGTAYGYSLTGGGYVGDRMLMDQRASTNSPFGPVSNTMIDITDGLGTLPSIGAFKITYDPNTGGWELYYEESIAIMNPMEITNMVGTATNNNFSNTPLPYLILSGTNTASTFFDNLTVMLEY